MTIALKLTHDEPRLIYLALVYHLGRPGSELDAETMLPLEHGLREVKVALGRDIHAPEAIIELSEWQLQRLESAIKGCVTELRVYHMREGAVSGIARWTETAESLFPGIKQDCEAALDVAEAMIMLHRRIERAVAKALRADSAAAAPAEEPTPRKAGRWPFNRA